MGPPRPRARAQPALRPGHHGRTRDEKVAVANEHLQAFIQQLMLLAAVPLRCTCVGTAGASSDDYPF